MKRLTVIVLALLLVVGMVTVSYAHPPIRLVLDGQTIQADAPPRIIADRTFVPLRVIAEHFDCQVDWNQEKQLVTISVYQNAQLFDQMYLSIGDPVIAFMHAKDQTIEAPPIIDMAHDRTLVPMRVIANFLNAAIEWDQQTYTVSMKKGEQVLYDDARAAQLASANPTPQPTPAPQPTGDKRTEVLGKIRALQQQWETRSANLATTVELHDEAVRESEELQGILLQLVKETPSLSADPKAYMANLTSGVEAWLDEHYLPTGGTMDIYLPIYTSLDYYYMAISQILTDYYGTAPITGEDIYGE